MLLTSFARICWFSLLIILLLFVYLGLERAEQQTTENYGFCGVIESGTYPHHLSENAEKGKTTFRYYCASCHNKNMKDDMTGPALSGTEARWADYPREDLYAWIRNSQSLVKEGHPRAVELFEQWNPNIMNSFPNLTDEEIEDVLVYIEHF